MVVRPAMMYSTEIWAVNIAQEKRLGVKGNEEDEWNHQDGQNKEWKN